MESQRERVVLPPGRQNDVSGHRDATCADCTETADALRVGGIAEGIDNAELRCLSRRPALSDGTGWPNEVGGAVKPCDELARRTQAPRPHREEMNSACVAKLLLTSGTLETDRACRPQQSPQP